MYIGYAISLKTAFTIFSFPQPNGNDATELYEALNRRLKTHDLKLYYYDKGVYILGKLMFELFVSSDTHVTVSDAIELMILYKIKIMENLKAAGANLVEFDIEVMEGEPTKVRSPQPYIMA
jgi:hypothetical protein